MTWKELKRAAAAGSITAGLALGTVFTWDGGPSGDWDGETPRVIVPRERWTNQALALNDFDHFAYMHSDFCPQQWVGDIRLYREGKTIVGSSLFGVGNLCDGR